MKYLRIIKRNKKIIISVFIILISIIAIIIIFTMKNKESKLDDKKQSNKNHTSNQSSNITPLVTNFNSTSTIAPTITNQLSTQSSSLGEEKEMQNNNLKSVKYWCYQLEGNYSESQIKEICNSKYDMVVIEPTKTCTDTQSYNISGVVNRIKNSKASNGVSNKKVIAYVSIGEAEEWRWYWPKISNNKDLVLSVDPDGWSGGHIVAYWKKEWKDIMMYGSTYAKGLSYNSSVDQALKDGFDGIYLDWVEGYSNESIINAAKKDGLNAKSEMLKFLNELRNYTNSRKPGFYIIQQNASSLAENSNEVFKYIDAIAQEGVWYDGTSFDGWDEPNACDIPNDKELTNYYLENLKRYLNNGKAVFNIDYAEKYADKVFKLARNEGYIPYCSRRSLSKLSKVTPY